MAESSITVYLIVIIVSVLFALVLRVIYQKRLKREGRSHGIISIKHENQYTIGVFIIFIGLYFIAGGSVLLTFSDFLDQYVEQSVKQEKPFYKNNTEIDFEDHEAFKTWITRAEIHSTDSDPLTTNYERGLQIIVKSKELPKSLVVHIFHEDMSDFFMNENDPTAYRQQIETLNKTLSLKYGPMFSADFDLSKYNNCESEDISKEKQCDYTFNTFKEGTLDTPGKYFVQFTAQLQDNSFDHRKSPLPLTTIMDPHDVWMEDQMKRLVTLTEAQNAEAKSALAWNFLAIGIGSIVGGIAMFVPSVEWKILRPKEK